MSFKRFLRHKKAGYEWECDNCPCVIEYKRLLEYMKHKLNKVNGI